MLGFVKKGIPFLLKSLKIDILKVVISYLLVRAKKRLL